MGAESDATFSPLAKVTPSLVFLLAEAGNKNQTVRVTMS